MCRWGTNTIIKSWNAYIPSNQGGSLTSSMVKTAFSSGEDTNFRRGAEGTDVYFLPTGYTT